MLWFIAANTITTPPNADITRLPSIIPIQKNPAEIMKQIGKKNKWLWILVIVGVGFTAWTFRKPIISLITKIPIK